MQQNWSNYTFTIYSPTTSWNDVGGIYIFAKKNALEQWVPLYIGKAESFQSRLSSHERWDDAMKAGVTHIHAMTVAQKAEREAIEAELIRKYQPSLNTQLR